MQSTVFDEGGEKEKIEDGIISFSFSLLTYILKHYYFVLTN
jgi:hypothetical protein